MWATYPLPTWPSCGRRLANPQASHHRARRTESMRTSLYPRFGVTLAGTPKHSLERICKRSTTSKSVPATQNRSPLLCSEPSPMK